MYIKTFIFCQTYHLNHYIHYILAPLCPLLSTKNEFTWTEDHEQGVVNANVGIFYVTKAT